MTLNHKSAPYYIDVVIFKDCWESNVVHLRTILIRLKENNRTLKSEKWYVRRHLNYLGLWLVMVDCQSRELYGRVQEYYPNNYSISTSFILRIIILS